MTDSTGYSDYIVYVDESGDHGKTSPEYPVFVLAFCIFRKDLYANEVTTRMHQLKFKHFGHDALVLHEREIRKAIRPFDVLQVAERREGFMSDLTELIAEAPFTVVAAVIHKERLAAQYQEPLNIYYLALQFGLERVERFRKEQKDRGKLHVIFEARGKREDDELELEFRRVCDENVLRRRFDMEPLFVRKEANHCGLQLADLVARPIGLRAMRPRQQNRAYDVIRSKFRSRNGKILGYGLKCFPTNKSKPPRQ